MKWKLMIQSISPLALLTIVNNFSFVCQDDSGTNLVGWNFVNANTCLIITMAICVLWFVLSVIFYFSFKASNRSNRTGGYTVTDISEQKEASLNFFMSLVLPLLIDNVEKWQGAITLALLIGMLLLLLSKTTLFYANPVLALLGYRVYEFRFTSNREFGDKTMIGICKGELSESHSIEYKKIADNVLYVR